MVKELDIYRQMVKMLTFIVVSILLCRFTQSIFAPIFVLLGVWCAFANKIGWALVYYLLMPFFIIINPGILPKESPLLAYSMRMGPLLIGIVLALMANGRRGNHRLPLFGLIPFLLVAAVSSVQGWAPSVSYLKIINFLVFLLGLWFGTQNLQDRPKDVFIFRGFFLAMAVIIVFGSILTMAVPSIGYATSLGYALREGGAELANEVYREQRADSLLTLFCGVTNHSQALGPMVCCMLGWTLCDMLFVERRFRWLHLLLVAGCFPLLYMTRSRTALFTAVFTVLLIYLYTLRKISVTREIQAKVKTGMSYFIFAVALVAIISELRSHAMSNWLVKYNAQDERQSMAESLTVSRQGLIDNSMYEFRRNPLLGSGFQVAWYTEDKIKGKAGLTISASVEKGVLPVMVLGETGVLGEFFFLLFLLSFFLICARRGYYVTMTLFATFLMSNMGEATFFSPGGGGGIMWLTSVVGGFTIDTTIIYRSRLMRQWTEMAALQHEQAMRTAGQRMY